MHHVTLRLEIIKLLKVFNGLDLHSGLLRPFKRRTVMLVLLYLFTAFTFAARVTIFTKLYHPKMGFFEQVITLLFAQKLFQRSCKVPAKSDLIKEVCLLIQTLATEI